MAALEADGVMSLSSDGLEAALHAVSELGPVQLGLVVESQGTSVLVTAPRLGQLQVELPLGPDGVPAPVLVSRLSPDGAEVSVPTRVVVDDAQVQALQQELAALKDTFSKVRDELSDQVAQLHTERDEARDRAEVMSEQRAALKERLLERERLLESQARQHEAALGEVQGLLEQSLLARAELERAEARATADLDRLRQETEAGSTTLLSELQEAKAAARAAEEALALQGREHAARQAQLEAQLQETEAARQVLEARTTGERQEVEVRLQAQAAQLQAAQQQLHELREALESERVEALRTEEDLEHRQTSLTDAVAARDGALQQREALSAELELLRSQLTRAQAEREEARTVAKALHQKVTKAEQAAWEAAAVQNALESERATLIADRDRLKLQIDALGRQLEGERSARARAVQERDEYRDRFKTLAEAPAADTLPPGPVVTPATLVKALPPAGTDAATSQSGPVTTTRPQYGPAKPSTNPMFQAYPPTQPRPAAAPAGPAPAAAAPAAPSAGAKSSPSGKQPAQVKLGQLSAPPRSSISSGTRKK